MEKTTFVNSKRIPYLDTLRVIACLMVILVHSPHPHEGMTSALSYGIISYLCSPCIGLFLMVSGALLLPMLDTTKEFLSKRLTRIIFPLISWSIIYILIALSLGNISLQDGIREFANIPFGCVTGFAHGWYLYLIIGIYLFLPIFNSWISSNEKRRCEYYLIFWAITMCYPYFIALVGNLQTYTFFEFSGYFGYVVLGYYLSKYPIKLSSAKQWGLFIFTTIFICAILPAIVYIANIPNYDTYNLIIYNYKSMHSAMMCVCIFIIIQRYNPSHKFIQKGLSKFSNLSFGIYLVNFAILREVFKPYFQQNPLDNVGLEILITFILSTIISYIIIWIISKLPFKKYIIG